MTEKPSVAAAGPLRSDGVRLFVASLAALYFEVLTIRYVSSELLFFAYLKNLPLIASFFAIGYGMLQEGRAARVRRVLPLAVLGLFALLRFAAPLGLSHAIISSPDYVVFATIERSPIVLFFEFIVVAAVVVTLLVILFIVLGGLIGESLRNLEPLPGYGLNLAGSLAGILLFTLLAFLDTPPVVWLLVGSVLLLALLPRDTKLVVSLAATVLLLGLPQRNVFWSPYYRVDLTAPFSPPGWAGTARQELEVNHDYHQRMLDLSPRFMARYPTLEPNRSATYHYDLPYLLTGEPAQVLIVGAGTGNDVAAALRHHAGHVDAVEIDPVILGIGRQRHPERPYDSPRVTTHTADARAFLKQRSHKYDLIVFGLLDSHTLTSSFSSLRLDNYVFTKESFEQARDMLSPGGTLVLAAASGGGFVTNRLFATLSAAFNAPPRVFQVPYEAALTREFIEGGARNHLAPSGAEDVTSEIQKLSADEAIATDRWPFLYLAQRKVPLPIISVFTIFLIAVWMLLRSSVSIGLLANRASIHFLFLGAGFLLLETKAVTELSLLFGSTWTVNTVVISSFLTMALLSTGVIAYRPVSRKLSYAVLFALLLVQLVLPQALLTSASGWTRIAAAALIAGLPVFFSGLIFAYGFADTPRPAVALGFNLFGALLGGFLENAVMYGGTTVLGVLAVLLYAASAAASPARAAPTAAPDTAMVAAKG